ncbi:MAG: NAD(P)-binding protein [Candidatus Pacebacteria bacterium]|nr:NAD(P)-binding protein [Candidatus Paceibacterota bacterium]
MKKQQQAKGKIAIVGAGTIGLYLAIKLSQKGYDIVVFEKKKKIGNKVCSGLFSERILNFFPESKKLIQNRIKSAVLNFPKKSVEVFFSKEFLVMSHYELDKLAASIARKAGVKIILGKDVNSIPLGFDRIIGCDGANSFVRRYLGFNGMNFRLGVQGFVKKRSFNKYVEVWPCNNGFIWKIPRRKEIEYGIISKPDLSLKIFKSFLDSNNISVSRVKSKIIPQGFVIPKNKSITLCGDSAGLTKPWSGGGVIWGLKAADILIDSYPDFKKYRKRAKRFFKLKIKKSKMITRLVYFIGFKMPWILPKKSFIESDYLF